MTTPYDLNGTPPKMNVINSLKLDNWLIAFVGSVDMRNEITGIRKNIEYNLDMSKRIKFLFTDSNQEKICLVGRNDAVRDFDDEILNTIRMAHNKMPLGTKVAIVFDCKDFLDSQYFDSVVLSKENTDYFGFFQYFCINTTKVADQTLQRESCKIASCSMCRGKPSDCSHTCFELLKEKI